MRCRCRSFDAWDGKGRTTTFPEMLVGRVYGTITRLANNGWVCPPVLTPHLSPTGEAIVVGIVRLALRRPYTFIVMALLIMIFGVTSAFRTPTDIFPNINIPLVSVVFSYTGLPPDDMAGGIVTLYERAPTPRVHE